MPVFGERKKRTLGKGYEDHSMREYAESFQNVITNVVNEGTMDYFTNVSQVFFNPSSKSALKKFFMENTFDPKDPEYRNAAKVQDHNKMMETLFENTVEAINEHTALNQFMPIQGVTLPVYKNVLMNQVFDKGAIPKAAAATPSFTRTMKRRFLVDKDGNRIDMFKDQDKIFTAIKETDKEKDVELTLANGAGVFNTIVKDSLNGSEKYDNLDVSSFISAVCIDQTFATGQKKPDGTVAAGDETVEVWENVNLKFTPGYGEQKLQLITAINIKVHDKVDNTYKPKTVNVFGSIQNNVLTVTTVPADVVKKIKFRTKLDHSNRRGNYCSVEWDETTTYVNIETTPSISTTVSPEELKDISALYGVNQLTEIMHLTKTAMSSYKDYDIKEKLDQSYDRMIEDDKFSAVYDFAPREGYALDAIEHRKKTFWDWLETQVTAMIQVLNDPNMTISIFGDPDLIRKIIPTEVSYETPQNLGPVELDYSRVVYTSNKRHYTFIGSDQLRWNDTFIVVLCPRNTDRITYIIYDYQMWFGNEIRQNDNAALPALSGFQRYKFDEYQPVQGRIQIANPSGNRPGDTATTNFREYK